MYNRFYRHCTGVRLGITCIKLSMAPVLCNDPDKLDSANVPADFPTKEPGGANIYDIRKR